MSTTAIRHFWESLPNGFWFRDGYEKLLNHLSTTKPSTWIEVGNWYGGSIAWVGVEAHNRGIPLTIHCVDIFRESTREDFDRNVQPIADLYGKRFKVHQGDSVEMAKHFKPASADVIWIDADHSYEGVKRDIEAFWPILKPGGYMGGDDFMPEYAGVEKAVREVFTPKGIEIGIHPGNRVGHRWDYWLVRKPA